MASMTAVDRVRAALRGDRVDFVPFTVYENMLPRCALERELRNAGLCIVRGVSVMRSETSGVETESHTGVENGERVARTDIRTPAGDLHSISRPAGFTSWTVRWPFSRPEDYAPLIYIAENTRYFPDYGKCEQALADAGGDIFLRGSVGYSPLQHIIYRLMGVEQFSIEWAERRDELMKLYEAITEERRRTYRILAESPIETFNYGGNVSPEVVGLDRFRKYILPHYEECAEIMQRRGKMMGVHFDADCRLIADDIARSNMDYVEAFTPAPDTDMTLADARSAWPDKALWINFTSSAHLASAERIEETTRDLLAQSGTGERFLVGITEDVPENRWRESYQAILRTIKSAGGTPLGK